MMNTYDLIYKDQFWKIMKEGCSTVGQDVRARWKDGSEAHTIELLNYQLKLDCEEVPILTSKHVAWKTAIREMFWIWQWKSNVVDDLRKLNGTQKTVWSEWEKEDGTIGKAYGWQLRNKKRKFYYEGSWDNLHLEPNRTYHSDVDEKGRYIELDQVDYLINTLLSNPSSRRIKTTLWCVEDLDDMVLEPCVYETHWQVQRRELHLTVNVRSNDLALGQPFNVFQYYILLKMIAQVTKLETGTLTFNIDNVHVYNLHIMGLQKQMQNEMYEAPELWINPEVTNFYDFTIDDFHLYGYTYAEKIKFEVAE